MRWWPAWALALVVFLTACGDGPRPVIVAATTSFVDAGLADALLGPLKEETGLSVKVVPVGSGQALDMARKGQADVVIAHAPKGEEAFMAQGYGLARLPFMANDFVVVGPPDDPAGVRGAATAREAFRRIFEAAAPFVSRADGSGTSERELDLWAGAGLNPRGRPWYHEVGAGMALALRVAHQRRAYTLSDRATFLALRDELGLDILLEGDPALQNVYHVLVVAPKAGAVNVLGARAVAQFLVSPRAQEIIGAFGRDRFGQPLFRPVADRER